MKPLVSLIFPLLLLSWMALVVDGASIRGDSLPSRHVRSLKKEEEIEETPLPSPSPSSLPSSAPSTPFPSSLPSSMPSIKEEIVNVEVPIDDNVFDNEEGDEEDEDDTNAPVDSDEDNETNETDNVDAPPPSNDIEDQPSNSVYDLQPFSLTLAGGSRFSNDAVRLLLQDYLLAAMNVAGLSEITLVPQINRRQLQNDEAASFAFTGTALFFADVVNVVDYDTENVQEAQIAALEDVANLQDYIAFREDVSLGDDAKVVQLQVESREIVSAAAIAPVTNPIVDNSQTNKKASAGFVAGLVLAGLCIIAGVLGLLVYWKVSRKPPPPPPYEMDILSEASDEIEVFEKGQKGLATTKLPAPEVDDIMEIGGATPSGKDNNDISRASSPKASTGSSTTQRTSPTSTENGRDAFFSRHHDPAILDLTRPAKNQLGLAPAPCEPSHEVVAQFKSAAAAATAASTTQSDSRSVAEVSLQPSRDDDTTIASIRTFPVNHDDDEDTMAGFSLASYNLAGEEALTLENSIEVTDQEGQSLQGQMHADGASTNHLQLKWIQRKILAQQKPSSASPLTTTQTRALNEVLAESPPRNTTQSDRSFVDNSSVEYTLDNDTIASESVYSSYKADADDDADDSDVMSGMISDAEESEVSVGGQGAISQAVSPLRGTHGALGYFHRDDDDMLEDEDEDMLPVSSKKANVSTPATQPVVYDSDAPSDERNQAEQDLTGFGKASHIQRRLDNLSTTPERLTSTRQGTSPTLDPTAMDYVGTHGSWEEDPEAFAKERRRVKRVTRNKRADRKQPPVTMEV